MIEPKLEVPAECARWPKKPSIRRKRRSGCFFDAAGKSMASVSEPGTQISRQALSFTEQNMKAAFDHARKLVHATIFRKAMQIQSGVLEEPVYQCRRAYETDHRARSCRPAKDASKSKL